MNANTSTPNVARFMRENGLGDHLDRLNVIRNELNNPDADPERVALIRAALYIIDRPAPIPYYT